MVCITYADVGISPYQFAGFSLRSFESIKVICPFEISRYHLNVGSLFVLSEIQFLAELIL